MQIRSVIRYLSRHLGTKFVYRLQKEPLLRNGTNNNLLHRTSTYYDADPNLKSYCSIIPHKFFSRGLVKNRRCSALYGHVGEIGDLRSGSSGGERSFGIWKDGEGLLAGTRRERNPPTQTQTSSLQNPSVDPSRSPTEVHRLSYHTESLSFVH